MEIEVDNARRPLGKPVIVTVEEARAHERPGTCRRFAARPGRQVPQSPRPFPVSPPTEVTDSWGDEMRW